MGPSVNNLHLKECYREANASLRPRSSALLSASKPPPIHIAAAIAASASPIPHRVSSREIAGSGFSTNRAASAFASSSTARSRIRLATRNSGSPACRVPKNSPGPRCCRSSSASSKPFCVRNHRVQPSLRLLAHPAASHQDAVALRRAAPHAPAQLMHLRQPKPLRMFDHHHRSHSAHRRRLRSPSSRSAHRSRRA